VGGEGQGREDAPPDEIPSLAAIERADKIERRRRAEECEECVAAGLLRVPEQHRVDRDEGRGKDPRPPVAELGREQVGDRNRGDPGDGGEGAQAELAGSRQLGPAPGQRVVERRRRLAVADAFHRFAEATAEDAADGDDLIVVERLGAERREAQDGGEDGEPGDDPEGARARSHPFAGRLREAEPGAPAERPRRLHPYFEASAASIAWETSST
jgi:hypothetical protein